MKTRRLMLLTGSSLLAIATSTPAQDTATAGFQLEEVVVTARRRAESLQDVPQTVNAVSAGEIQKLNFRKFEDIASVVPGLQMATNANGIGATASVRGVNYDVNASGNNATVEFYMNDAPISAGNLFQTMYDIQQVELLRGPQGTLRGRASPSGSMTVTTRRPDLAEVGGYVSATANDIGGYNGQGAVSFPIVTDKLALRVAGAYEENEFTRVESIFDDTDPSSENKSGRATLLFEPTDGLSFQLSYQNTVQDIVAFDQVESQQVMFPNAPVFPGAPGGPAPTFIRAGDRLSVQEAPRVIKQEFENINLQAEWRFAGQKLSYVGARNDQHMESQESADVGNFFPETYQLAALPIPPSTVPSSYTLQDYGQYTDSNATSYQHELRLSSEERIGIFDYSVGAFYQEQDSPTNLSQQTVVLFGPPSPATPYGINATPIERNGTTEEKSVFAQLTAHFGEALEVAGGLRYIEYKQTGELFVNGVRNPFADQDDEDDATIYTLSASYRFSDDFMVYANTGTSWRPGPTAVGDFSLRPSALETSFLTLDAEESTSYEVGFKASGFDNRLRGSLAAYYQDFENYPYRSAGGVYFREVTALGATPAQDSARVRPFNFIAAVPVEVYGVEADLMFVPIPQWDIGLSAAYAKGEIKNGLIPCNDYSPRDGIPDGPAAPPSAQGILDATGGDNLSACTVTYASSSAPEWSASLQSEYRLDIGATMEGYIRGLLSMYGDSENDPANTVDDYKGYELLNLYVGLRDADGRWDVGLYGKNVTEKELVLSRSSSTLATPYNIGPTGTSGVTNYYGGTSISGMTMTAPREFGLMARYSFGSR
jgi:iron complex outermembrane recepter protein